MRTHTIRTGLMTLLASLSSYGVVEATETPENIVPVRVQQVVDRVTVFAGPETVKPNNEIYIAVEVLNDRGGSIAQRQRVTVYEVSKGNRKSWTSKTERGLARVIIPAGQVSRDREFYARVNGQVSKPVSVFVTSGRVDTVKSNIRYVEISNNLMIDIGPLDDRYGNILEDGTLISFSTRTPSGEMTYDSAPLIRGRAQWVLPCERYRAGIAKLTVSVKNTQKNVSTDGKNCPNRKSDPAGQAS